MLRMVPVMTCLLCFSSCMFYTQRKNIRSVSALPARTVQFVSGDSLLVVLDRDAYFKTLQTDSTLRSEASRLDRLFPGNSISIDSICSKAATMDIRFRSNDFIITQLDQGHVIVTNLHTGDTVKKYRRSSRYVRPGFLRKGDLVYKSYQLQEQKKEVFFRRYRTIHF